MYDAAPDNLNQQERKAQTPPPDPSLQDFARLRRYIKSGKIPWRKLSSWKREDLCNADLVSPQDVGYRDRIPFPLRAHRFASGRVFQDSLRDRFLPEIGDAAIHALKRKQPTYSAAHALSLSQNLLFLGFVCVFAICIATFPLATIIAANTLITAYFLLAIVYRFVLMVVGWKSPPSHQAPTPADAELPVITILLPLYHDAEALAPLSRAIDALDYPPDKLDIKLLLEAADTETLAEARKLRIDARYDVILVPEGGPRTKPKACNYGLHLARAAISSSFSTPRTSPNPISCARPLKLFTTPIRRSPASRRGSIITIRKNAG